MNKDVFYFKNAPAHNDNALCVMQSSSFKVAVTRPVAIYHYCIAACYSAPVGERSIVISLSVCASVREHISVTAGPIFAKLFVRIP